MKLLVAALMPTSGSIRVDGQPLARAERQLKAGLGYLPQDFGLFDELTVTQFLDYMAALKGLKGSANAVKAVKEAIALVNLEEKAKSKIRTLSGGQRQRVGIAQALLGDPRFLIFDEPTVGLDPEERIHFRNLFSRTAQERLVLRSAGGHRSRQNFILRYAGAADPVRRRPRMCLLGKRGGSGTGAACHGPGQYRPGRPVPGGGGPASGLRTAGRTFP